MPTNEYDLHDVVNLWHGPTSKCRRAKSQIMGRDVRVRCRNRGCANGCGALWKSERLAEFREVTPPEVFEQLAVVELDPGRREAFLQRLRRRQRSGCLLGWWSAPTERGCILITDGIGLGRPWYYEDTPAVTRRVARVLDEIASMASDGARPGNVRFGGDWYVMARRPWELA